MNNKSPIPILEFIFMNFNRVGIALVVVPILYIFESRIPELLFNMLLVPAILLSIYFIIRSYKLYLKDLEDLNKE
ncbi:MAG: hypothetical protein RLZ47_326 [Bacteroidota bacterium]|jgi:hypothetical protein